MNIGTNERDHPNSSPLHSPAGQGGGASISLADTQIKQVSLVFDGLKFKLASVLTVLCTMYEERERERCCDEGSVLGCGCNWLEGIP